MTRWKHALLVATSLALATAPLAATAAPWPEREVNLTVNYGAGGVTDVATRMLGKLMERSLGKPVVVQNRPGAQATLGPAFLARQAPDGYNIGVVTMASLAIAPHLVQANYTPADFDYIGAYGRFQFGMAVRADSGIKNVADLVALAKSSGKSVFFGAPGAPNNVAMFDLGRKAGVKFDQVPYKSGAETVNALLAGDVTVIIQTPSEILPHVDSGKLRLIAAVSPARWPLRADVPTVREQGYDIAIQSWMGLAAPKGTPKDVIQKLQEAMVAATKDPEFVQRFGTMGIDALTLSGPEYHKLAEESYKEMAVFLKQTGDAKK